MSTPDDRKLLGLLDSLSPDHVQRLKTQPEDPSIEGPETYRGVRIPDDLRAGGATRAVFEEWKRGVDAELDKAEPGPVDENPFAPDLTMSREVADFVLRAFTGLLEEGYWPKGYDAQGRHGGVDDQDYDFTLIRRAADLVGRGRIRNSELLAALADMDEEASG
jgi:hypothetical protein